MAKKDAQDNAAFQAVKQAIRNRTPERLYIFHGEEVFLLHHYLDQLRKKIVDELTESFNYHRLNNENFDIQAFADGVENFPMMAERTMVQVDEIDLFKLPEGDRGKMAELLSDIKVTADISDSYFSKSHNIFDPLSKYII